MLGPISGSSATHCLALASPYPVFLWRPRCSMAWWKEHGHRSGSLLRSSAARRLSLLPRLAVPTPSPLILGSSPKQNHPGLCLMPCFPRHPHWDIIEQLQTQLNCDEGEEGWIRHTVRVHNQGKVGRKDCSRWELTRERELVTGRGAHGYLSMWASVCLCHYQRLLSLPLCACSDRVLFSRMENTNLFILWKPSQKKSCCFVCISLIIILKSNVFLHIYWLFIHSSLMNYLIISHELLVHSHSCGSLYIFF